TGETERADAAYARHIQCSTRDPRLQEAAAAMVSDDVATAERTFDDASTLHGLFPHMHFRGRSFSYEAVYPDATRELLLSTPNYSFNWQRAYMLEEPRNLPAGTKIVCRAVFDNSAQNKFNPDPTQTVKWGDQSFDEMLIGYMGVTRARRADAAVAVDASE
ncbi:MAG: hypothetical protein ABGY41_00640, partial [Candidatus Poribacteria bacterium]